MMYYIWTLTVIVALTYIVFEMSGALTLKRLMFAALFGVFSAILFPFGFIIIVAGIIFFLFHPESVLNNPKSIFNKALLKKTVKDEQ